ncbi:Pimeloyl-ACP methyl ester carboxylesterase [Robiginitalea myxolifaciens]|uniref:Pimeloyl-ACP methyl ester carboxylesterase n=1 Tax=Robiginitalea myxolifaciens TaxID=400055 RepID=A0A1I6G1Y4_9FLAO|nr:alpha/beta hydrolase [Robiginitalea myxolifaciens]SFR36188.1 Pimeloyl-ACP methyl ester carboxylesterase [Robiginitalea myxolifaciens]
MKIRLTLLTCFLIAGLNAQSSSFKAEVTGSGPPIVLIPGFTCGASVWDTTVQALSSKYQCHVLTLAGFDGQPPIEFPWLPQIKDDLKTYLAANELENPVVIGHSLGGTLGLWLAADGVGLSRLIIVDALPAAGALMIPNFDPDQLAYDSPWNNQLLQMDEQQFAAMAGQMASGMSANPEVHGQLKDWIIEADRKTYVYGYTDYLKLDLREALEQISIPVDILAATLPFGEDTARQNYEQQYAKLQDYRLTFIADSSHFIMYDQPEAFQQNLKSILNY